MNIMKAVQKSLDTGRPMFRKDINLDIYFLPSNSSDCIYVFCAGGEKIGKRWNPNASDILSDEWELMDKPQETAGIHVPIMIKLGEIEAAKNAITAYIGLLEEAKKLQEALMENNDLNQ